MVISKSYTKCDNLQILKEIVVVKCALSPSLWPLATSPKLTGTCQSCTSLECSDDMDALDQMDEMDATIPGKFISSYAVIMTA